MVFILIINLGKLIFKIDYKKTIIMQISKYPD